VGVVASTGLGLSGRADVGAGVRANCNVELSFPALLGRNLSQVALYLYLFKPVMVQLFSVMMLFIFCKASKALVKQWMVMVRDWMMLVKH
jgi:hypothetical protein